MAIQQSAQPAHEIAQPRSETSAEIRELPLDIIYDLLSNQRRRYVLRYLSQESESTTLGEVAEHIAGIENDKPEDQLTSTERKRVYIVLYQCHLPKMDDAGVIEFDEDRKTIEVGGTIDQVLRFLPHDEGVVSNANTSGWTTAIAGLTTYLTGSFRS